MDFSNFVRSWSGPRFFMSWSPGSGLVGYGPWIPDWYIYMSSVPIFLYSEHGLSLMKSGDKPRSGHLNDKNVSIQSDCIGMTANIIWPI